MMVLGNPFFNYLDFSLSLHHQPLRVTCACHDYVQAMRTCRKWTFSTLGYMHDNYHKEYKLGNGELNNLTIILTMNKRHRRLYAWFFFPNNSLFNLFFFFFFPSSLQVTIFLMKWSIPLTVVTARILSDMFSKTLWSEMDKRISRQNQGCQNRDPT